MAAGNFTLYDAAKLAILNGGIDLDTDNIAVALATSSYIPAAAHDTWADVSATECADVDYAQKTLGSAALTLASGAVTFDSADVSFGTTVDITAKYAVLVKGTTGALVGTELLVGYIDLKPGGGSASSTNSIFSVNTPNGLFIAT